MNRKEYVDAGMAADPSDSTWRLTDEWRTTRGRAQAQENGLELLTPEAAALVFGKGQSTIRRALAKERVRTAFDIQGGFGGPAVRLITLKDAVAYWGAPVAEQLKTLRQTGYLFGIHSATWSILSPAPPFTVKTR